MNESLSLEIDRALSTLTERESEIVKMFFGLGCQEMTLEEIGDKFGLTGSVSGKSRKKPYGVYVALPGANSLRLTSDKTKKLKVLKVSVTPAPFVFLEKRHIFASVNFVLAIISYE